MAIRLPDKLPTTQGDLEILLSISKIKEIPDKTSYENIRALCDRLSDLPQMTVGQNEYFLKATNLMYDYEQKHYPMSKVE